MDQHQQRHRKQDLDDEGYEQYVHVLYLNAKRWMRRKGEKESVLNRGFQ